MPRSLFSPSWASSSKGEPRSKESGQGASLDWATNAARARNRDRQHLASAGRFLLPLEVMANRLPWMSVLVVGIASLHCNGSAGTSSGIGAASTPDASVGGGAAPPFAPEDDEASSSPDASYDVGSPDDAPDARLDASPDAMTDAPFTAPADASTDAALDEDPPP